MTYREIGRRIGRATLLFAALLAALGAWTAPVLPAAAAAADEGSAAVAWSSLAGLPAPAGLERPVEALPDPRDGSGRSPPRVPDSARRGEPLRPALVHSQAHVAPCPTTAERLPYHATAPPPAPLLSVC